MPHGEVRPDSVREVYRGSLIRVEVETWPVGDREVVRHPGGCGMVALTARGEVILVRQRREAVRESLLEIPAGIFDIDGEEGSRCAARELLEETGYRAEHVESLGRVYTSPGFTDERLELYTARAVPAGEGVGPLEAGVEPVLMPLPAAVAAIRDGRIRDAKTFAGVLLVWAQRSG